MAKRGDGFPWWLMVLGFPLLGGVYLVLMTLWAVLSSNFGWVLDPPYVLVRFVTRFVGVVAEPIWEAAVGWDAPVGVLVVYCIVVWEVVWLIIGLVVAGAVRLLVLLVPRSEGDEG